MSYELERENEGKLTAKDIMDKVRNIQSRGDGEVDSSEFIELLARYPNSICTRIMSDKLKLIIALLREEDIHEENGKQCYGFSYEKLSILFDRSKASIYEAIHEKRDEAKRILKENQLKAKVHDIALAELVQEEKIKLIQEKEHQ